MENIVPCNGCRACCYGPVTIHPALGDDPSKYELTIIQDVGIMIKRREDGSAACRYLADNGCGIWKDRPALCRAFDCRIYARLFAAIDPHRDEAVVKAGLERS